MQLQDISSDPVTITDLPMMVTHEFNDSVDLALYIQICRAICRIMNVLVLPWQQKVFFYCGCSLDVLRFYVTVNIYSDNFLLCRELQIGNRIVDENGTELGHSKVGWHVFHLFLLQ